MSKFSSVEALIPPPPAALSGPHEDLLAQTVTQLAAAIRDKELSSRELTLACIDRVEALDHRDTLNSFVLCRGEDALKDADRLDELLAAGTVLGPLHGVPVGIKDALPVKGVRTTGGTSILRDWVPDEDATLIRLLKDAGALVLGMTNMHEWGFGITSNNPVYGAVRNPYDASRLAGGSSGGSGAAVSARLCPAAFGTDTGASIRQPAALCGVIGLKPTRGRVSRGGMLGHTWIYDVAGPITRSVADAALLLSIVSSGPDPLDPDAMHDPAGAHLSGRIDDARTSLRGLRIGTLEGWFTEDNTPEVDRVLVDAHARLREAGAELIPVTVKDVELMADTGLITVVPESVVFTEDAFAKAGISGGLVSVLDQFGDDVRSLYGPQFGVGGTPIPAHEYVRAINHTIPAVQRGFASAIEGVDVLLTTTTVATAVPLTEDEEMLHNGRKLNTFATYIRNTFCVNAAGYPAISIPGGLGESGLPVGLQFIGAPWGEARLLEIAQGYERLGVE